MDLDQDWAKWTRSGSQSEQSWHYWDQIRAQIEQSGHYRSPNRAKWALSGVDVVQGWIDLDTLSYGKSGRFLDTVDKIKGSTGQLALRTLAKAGQYLLVGQPGGDFKMPQVWLPQKAMTVRGSHVGNSPQLRRLIDMVRAGKVKQMPIERRQLSGINQAVEDLEKGRVTGRIVFITAH